MGIHIDLDQLRYDDPRVYRMITLADTVGVFQLDSRAQSQNLPFQRPHSLADLSVATSLIRPGPIIAGTVRAYYRRLLGQEPITYLHPSLEGALFELARGASVAGTGGAGRSSTSGFHLRRRRADAPLAGEEVRASGKRALGSEVYRPGGRAWRQRRSCPSGI